MKNIKVVGIGNYILQDEGVGVHVINKLLEKDFPPQVELIDGGTHSYDLVDFFCQADILIIIDAMQAGGEPGTMYRASLDELGLKQPDDCTSVHELHFIEAVKMVRMLGYDPEIVVFGVEPAVIDWGMELTPQVAEQIPRLTELVTEEINKYLTAG